MKCFLFFIVFRGTMNTMKINELLKYGKENLIGKEEPYRLAKMLLKFLLQKDDHYLLLHQEEIVAEDIIKQYEQNIQLLKQGVPIQYITHKQEFMGLDFYVDENVLIPQPDTEVLVEQTIEILKEQEGMQEVLDLCTGSGAIGISIAKYVKNSKITMSDISEKALAVAQINAEKHQVLEQCKFVVSNMFERIDKQFDVIVSNPPYIQSDMILALEKEVQNEPHLALDGGIDGLDFYRTIAFNTYPYLKPNGILALEIGYDQKDAVIEILEKTNQYKNIVCKQDLSGNNRVIICNI